MNVWEILFPWKLQILERGNFGSECLDILNFGSHFGKSKFRRIEILGSSNFGKFGFREPQILKNPNFPVVGLKFWED